MAVWRGHQVRSPTRAQIRVVPTAAWVYGAIGVVALAALGIPMFAEAATSIPGISLWTVARVFDLAFPAFAAAALTYVAPRSRLVQIAALSFAIPVGVAA